MGYTLRDDLIVSGQASTSPPSYSCKWRQVPPVISLPFQEHILYATISIATEYVWGKLPTCGPYNIVHRQAGIPYHYLLPCHCRRTPVVGDEGSPIASYKGLSPQILSRSCGEISMVLLLYEARPTSPQQQLAALCI